MLAAPWILPGSPVLNNDLVYIVDDNQDVRASLAFLLGSLGYRCDCYRSGEDFLANLGMIEPGCVLLDVRMEGLTGLQVLSQMRLSKFDWPVVMVTGHGDASIEAQARALGAEEFLEKPIEAELLSAVLSDAFLTFAAVRDGAPR